MSQLSLYRNEIFNFLKTVTIKFDQLGILINEQLKYTYTDIDDDDRTTWPYYLNMIGEYHASNTMMQIKSIDTGDIIDFTKSNLELHPKTALLYKPGLEPYKVLCNKYPNQIDLIRSIVYPVSDMDTALDADDFSLVTYDSSFLHINERTDMIEYLTNILAYYGDRWYIPEFNYEELYPLAYWGILWYNLPLIMLTRRMQNLHTSCVHPFHIKEYLESKGITEIEVLNDEQKLFLYRNINYIIKNRGKESTLLILAENLLKRLKVSVVGKNIYHHTQDTQDTCMWIPEFISYPIVNYETNPNAKLNKIEDVATINQRLYDEKLELENTTTRVKEVSDKLSYTDRNIMPTKLIEIQKYTIDNKYENLLLRFSLDTMIERMVSNKTNFLITFKEDITGTTFEDMDLKTAIAFLNLCIYRTCYQEVEYLPRFYTVTSSYYGFARPTEYPTTFILDSRKYNSKFYVDIDSLVNEIPYDASKLGQDDTMNLIADQFNKMIKHIRYIRSSTSKHVHLAVRKLYETLVPTRTIDLNLDIVDNYAAWLVNNPQIQYIVDYYDNNANAQEYYDTLATQLLRNIIPFKNEKFNQYLATTDSDDTYLYSGLKRLFVQLCSYNVTFLDTDRTKSLFMFLSNITGHFDGHDEDWDTIFVDKINSGVDLNSTLITPLRVEHSDIEFRDTYYDSTEKISHIEQDVIVLNDDMNQTHFAYRNDVDMDIDDDNIISQEQITIESSIGFNITPNE